MPTQVYPASTGPHCLLGVWTELATDPCQPEFVSSYLSYLGLVQVAILELGPHRHKLNIFWMNE